MLASSLLIVDLAHGTLLSFGVPGTSIRSDVAFSLHRQVIAAESTTVVIPATVMPRRPQGDGGHTGLYSSLRTLQPATRLAHRNAAPPGQRAQPGLFTLDGLACSVLRVRAERATLMEIWTYDEAGGWIGWARAALGLDAIVSAASPTDQMLVVQRSPADEDEVCAVIGLARRLCNGTLTVTAGHEHPSTRWRDSVRQAGADRAVLVSDGARVPLDDATEVGDQLCPELLVDPGPTRLSVRERYRDRMVLARHHFDRWCLAGKELCPHWRETPG